MSAPKNGGPAFPTDMETMHGETVAKLSAGMTLRDYFAAHCLPQGWTPGSAEAADGMARACYLMADAMLAERTRRTP